MKRICNCPYTGVHETYCNVLLPDAEKTTCPACGRIVAIDEIISVHNLKGDWYDECEYCIED